MQIKQRHIEMMKPRGFDRLFDREVNDHYTKKEAFWELNNEFKEVFGRYRYKNYHSYRMSRKQRISAISSN